MTAIIATATVPAHSRLDIADTAVLPTIDVDAEDLATARTLSAFLQDPDSDPVSKASIRAGITRMVKIAEDVALLTRRHTAIKAAVTASPDLSDEQRRELLAGLAEYDGRDGSVVFRVLTEEEDNTALWKAFASGARLALGGADDTAEAWRAPAEPLGGEAMAAYLTKLRAEMDAGTEDAA